MPSVITLFNDGQGNIAMGLAKLADLLIFRSLIGCLSSSKRFELDDHCEMAWVSLSHISVQIPAEKAGPTLGQIGLRRSQVGPHPCGIGDGSSDVPVTLGHAKQSIGQRLAWLESFQPWIKDRNPQGRCERTLQQSSGAGAIHSPTPPPQAKKQGLPSHDLRCLTSP